MLEDEQEIPFFQPQFPEDSTASELETTEEPSEIQITPDLVKKIRQELGVITLCWPEIHQPKFEDRTTFPEPYYTNNDKERLCLLYAENFRRQFSSLWPKRRPILLACENECGIQKMVCTTIRPTMLGYAELYEWDGCAKFIADHIKYEVLEKPTLLPRSIKREIARKNSGLLRILSTRMNQNTIISIETSNQIEFIDRDSIFSYVDSIQQLALSK